MAEISLKSTEFDSEQYEHIYPQGINNHYWNKARNHIIYAAINSGNQPVVEVGCGRGAVTAFLKNKGIDVFGLELADCEPLEEAKGHIKTNIDACAMHQSFTEKFKTLLLLDVIEHIEDPKVFIRNILNHYTNVREIIITVPARKEIWSNYDEYNGHFRRYDIDMTNDLMSSLNLNISQNQYFFHSLYWPARYLARLKKPRSLQINAPKSFLAKGLHYLLSRFFRLEKIILPGKWKGSSILVKASVSR